MHLGLQFFLYLKQNNLIASTEDRKYPALSTFMHNIRGIKIYCNMTCIPNRMNSWCKCISVHVRTVMACVKHKNIWSMIYQHSCQKFTRVLLIFLNWFVIHIDYLSNHIGHNKNRITSKYSLIKQVCLSNKMHHIWNINIDQAFDQEVISCAISNFIQHIRSIWQSFQQRKNRKYKAEITQIYYLNSKNHVEHEVLPVIEVHGINLVNITALCDWSGQYWWVS